MVPIFCSDIGKILFRGASVLRSGRISAASQGELTFGLLNCPNVESRVVSRVKGPEVRGGDDVGFINTKHRSTKGISPVRDELVRAYLVLQSGIWGYSYGKRRCGFDTKHHNTKSPRSSFSADPYYHDKEGRGVRQCWARIQLREDLTHLVVLNRKTSRFTLWNVLGFSSDWHQGGYRLVKSSNVVPFPFLHWA